MARSSELKRLLARSQSLDDAERQVLAALPSLGDPNMAMPYAFVDLDPTAAIASGQRVLVEIAVIRIRAAANQPRLPARASTALQALARAGRAQWYRDWEEACARLNPDEDSWAWSRAFARLAKLGLVDLDRQGAWLITASGRQVLANS